MVAEYLQEYSDSLQADNLKLKKMSDLQEAAMNSAKEESRILGHTNDNLRRELVLRNEELERLRKKKKNKNAELWTWRIGAIVAGYFLLK
jgi:hypothetical protein